MSRPQYVNVKEDGLIDGKSILAEVIDKSLPGAMLTKNYNGVGLTTP